MLTYIYLVIKMKHHLNYSKEDPNYILLGKIFKIIGSRKAKTIIASKGVKNINMMILSIKIIFTAIFFNTTVEFVVQELKRDKKLRKFFEISDVPDALQISEFLSRFNSDTYITVSYTHLRAHETPEHLVCRLLLEKKKKIPKLRPSLRHQKAIPYPRRIQQQKP